MRVVTNWLRRRIELVQHAGRRRELEREFSAFYGSRVRLVAAAVKGGYGGYDEIYHALDARQRVAVVRVNSPFRRRKTLTQDGPLSRPLSARERLDWEWSLYERLSRAGVSPRPLWRTDDAAACSWLNWDRASQTLIHHRRQFWPLMECLLPAISRMHACGVTHLDLNLGNVLAQPGGRGIAFIDFEFAPQPCVAFPEQCAFDYLRLIDDCARPRRGGRELQHGIDRLIAILDACVPPDVRSADLQLALDRLRRVRAQRSLREQLSRIFTGLSGAA